MVNDVILRGSLAVKKCEHCGKEFIGRTAGNHPPQYCSDACKLKAWRAKKKAEKK